MKKLAHMDSEVVNDNCTVSEDNHIKPVIIGGNVVACFANGEVVPCQRAAELKSNIDGFTTLTVTVVVREE